MERDNSEVCVHPGGITLVGPDAVALFRAMTIRRAILLYVKTGLKANRAYTPNNMKMAATSITGKPYKAGKASLQQAADDLDVWINTMRAALPVTKEASA